MENLEHTVGIPAKIRTFLTQLHANDHEAYIVGGAVRDIILGKQPKDWDVATSATPEQIIKTFAYLDNVQFINAKFPVVDVDGIDIATFRIDNYDNGELVDCLQTDKLNVDLLRRDLTINAMAMDLHYGIIDPYDGIKDCQNGIIRFVGNPAQRIIEDPCRIVRACRFRASTGFMFDIDTELALGNAVLFGNHKIAPERLRIEILKVMNCDEPSIFFKALRHIGMLAEIFPSLNACFKSEHGQYHDEDIFEHMMIAGDAIPKAIKKVFKETNMSEEKFALIRLTGYLHDIGKSEPNFKDGAKHFYDHQFSGSKLISKELKKLKFTNDEIKYAFNLVLHHMAGSEKMSPKSTRKLIAKFVDNDVNWKHWLVIKCADRTAHLRMAHKPLKIEKIANKFLHELDDKISHRPGPCFEHKALAISGTTIRKVLGIEACQFVGTALDFCLNQVIAHPELNTREDLIFLLTGRSEKKRWLKSA